MMACCTARCTLMTICCLQMLALVERFVFDMVGFMWTPVLVGVLAFIAVLIGMFGIHQYRPKFIHVYGLWHLLWIGWNIFIICFYLEVGELNLKQHNNILNMGTGANSWWFSNGFGCVVKTRFTTRIDVDSNANVDEKLLSVKGCVLDGSYIEVIHAGVQIVLAILGIIGALFVNKKFVEEEDSFDFIGGFDSNYSSYNSHAQQREPEVAMQPVYIYRGAL